MPANLDEFVVGRLPLQPDETPLTANRPSIRLFIGEALQAITLVGLTIGVSVFFERVLGVHDPFQGPLPTFGLSAVGLEMFYLVPRLLRALINVAFTEYVLTNERVYARTEFISTDLKIVPYEKVTHVHLGRGLFGRILGISELRLQAYGAAEGAIRMRGLRDPLPAFWAARRLIRQHNTAEALVRSD